MLPGFLKEDGQEIDKPLELEINGINFNVENSGIRFWSYRLTCSDFIIAIAAKPTNVNPNVRDKAHHIYDQHHRGLSPAVAQGDEN